MQTSLIPGHEVVRQSARIRDRLTGRLVRAGMREMFRCVSWGGGCARVPGRVPRVLRAFAFRSALACEPRLILV